MSGPFRYIFPGSRNRRLSIAPASKRPPAPPQGGGDTAAPSVPANLQVSAQNATSMLLAFDASTDDTGVAGYNIYRDGAFLDSTPTTSYTDLGLTPSTSYSYEVSAYDAAGNESARSAPVADTTDALVGGGGPGIIFETDWRNDAGYDEGSNAQGSWTAIENARAYGWQGTWIQTFGGGESAHPGRIYAAEGEGIGGSRAMKFEWDVRSGQPVSQMFKHLTGSRTTGISDLYIRYNVRLPNGFRAGDPNFSNELPYWKWGRVWQNTGVFAGQGWTENRVDSGYIVWNWGGEDRFGVDAGITMGANSGNDLANGSNGGARYSAGYDPAESGFGGSDFSTLPGMWRHVGNTANTTDPNGGWNFNGLDTGNGGNDRFLVNNTNQQYHTIEWHFRLSSTPGAFDGIHEMWYDGDIQPIPDAGRPGPKNGAPGIPAGAPNNVLPTSGFAPGNGFNMFVLFDNMTFWNEDWGSSDRNGVFVNDVVVSGQRIGHDYVAGYQNNTGVGET